MKLAKNLAEHGVPFVAVSTCDADFAMNQFRDVTDFADVHIDLKLSKGLLPDDTGTGSVIQGNGRFVCLSCTKIYAGGNFGGF